MAKVVNNITELIGDTPIVKLSKIVGENSAEVYAKLESFNPLSSVKDRICLSMIEAAEKQGKIKPYATIIEPTSGNTGIGLAYICAQRGYELILTMPESMSVERRGILKALGAEVILTEAAKGMKGAIEKAQQLADKNGYYQPQQFKNPANPEIHRRTTAKEILEQVPYLNAFVAGVGTGGTITGVGEQLKKKNKDIQIIAVEPEGSPVLSGGNAGPHKIQGIGAGFIPKVLNTEIIDRIIKVSDEDAKRTARELAKQEGIFCGISSGASLFAALQVAKELGKQGKLEQKVVVILPDGGERYLSTELYKY